MQSMKYADTIFPLFVFGLTATRKKKNYITSYCKRGLVVRVVHNKMWNKKKRDDIILIRFDMA